MKRIVKIKLFILILLIYSDKYLASNVFDGGWCGDDVSKCNPPENGDFLRCDMCMCKNLNKFVLGIDPCSNNHILYACYISYRSIEDPPVVSCKVELKKSWFLGFVLGSCFVCSLICLGIGAYSIKYFKTSKKIDSYKVEVIEEKKIEQQENEINDLESTPSTRKI